MATEYKHPGILFEGMILQGWALAVQGDIDQGMAQLRQGMANSIALGQLIHRTFNLLLLAEIEAMAGRVEAGLLALDEALTIAHAKDGSYLESEIYRSHGELLLLAGRSAGEAEIAFQKALSVARYQHTKSLELRATVSLCRLWQQQGRYSEAHVLLAAIYGWFTEGFDTRDLIEARSLLAELASAAVAG